MHFCPLEPNWRGAILLNRLKSEDVRMKIKHEINEDTSWENPVRSCGGWQSILIISAPKTPQYEGKTMLEAAQKANKEPGDLIFDIIIANKGKTAGCMFMMEEKDVKNIMRHPATMVASDGIPSPPGAKSHPRMAGAFARILGYYVRKENVLSLEKAVKKMTGMPARRLGLLQKGFVHLGFDADIVVFDPDMVNDCATYQEPLKPPTGINYVIVGGKTVLEHGELTGAHPGKCCATKTRGIAEKTVRKILNWGYLKVLRMEGDVGTVLLSLEHSPWITNSSGLTGKPSYITAKEEKQCLRKHFY